MGEHGKVMSKTKDTGDTKAGGGLTDTTLDRVWLLYYQVNGTPDKRATFICCMHKAEALANAYYWNKLARALGSNERFSMRLDREKATKIVGDAEYARLAALAKETE